MSAYSVVVGMHNKAKYEPSTRRHSIQRVIIHENYKGIRKPHPFLYDIALLELRKKIRYTDQTSPICLDDSTLASNATCYSTGWGWTSWRPDRDFRGMSATQYAISVIIVKRSSLQRLLRTISANSQI